VNGANELVNLYRYHPFGTDSLVSEQVPNPLRFQARELDRATDLYYFRARWYDADLARFISEDPIGLEGGINLYAFAGNNPVNLTDPWGLETCELLTFTASVGDITHTWYEWKCTGGGDGSNPNPSCRGGCHTYGPGGTPAGPGGGGGRGGGGGSRNGPTAAVPSSSSSSAQCIAGLGLNTASAATGVSQYTNIRGSGANLRWRGANNKWYSAAWGGNQWTGGRNAVVAAGRRAQVTGRAIGGAGIILSGGLAVASLARGDWAGGARYTVDAVMGSVGTFGGPVGLGVSLAYFGVTFYAGC
jgi:RHS repeat-associated protein